jgi:hypothetical protein
LSLFIVLGNFNVAFSCNLQDLVPKNVLNCLSERNSVFLRKQNETRGFFDACVNKTRRQLLGLV